MVVDESSVKQEFQLKRLKPGIRGKRCFSVLADFGLGTKVSLNLVFSSVKS